MKKAFDMGYFDKMLVDTFKERKIEELKLMLEESSRVKFTERDAQIAQNTQDVMYKVPEMPGIENLTITKGFILGDAEPRFDQIAKKRSA